MTRLLIYSCLVAFSSFLSSCNMKNMYSSTMIGSSRIEEYNDSKYEFNNTIPDDFMVICNHQNNCYLLFHNLPTKHDFDINIKEKKYLKYELINLDFFINISKKYEQRRKLYSYIASKQYDKFLRECNEIEQESSPEILNLILFSKEAPNTPWSPDENFSYNMLENILYRFSSSLSKITLSNKHKEGLKKVLKLLIKKKLSIKSIGKPQWFWANEFYNREYNVKLILSHIKEAVDELDIATKIQVLSVIDYCKKHNPTFMINMPYEIIDEIFSFIPTFSDVIDNSVREYLNQS